jgi:UDP-galactopyranose mutase
MSAAPKVLVVGAGFAGATCARVLADAGCDVHVVEQRPHIAGNAYDRLDAHGVMIHEYGPHIFHTNSKKVIEFLSRFTTWRFYEHRVLADLGDKRVPIPINRTTVNTLYGLDLDEAGVAAFFEKVREPREPVRSSADVVIGSVGRELCDIFFRGYTRKQWGLELEDLSAGVAARIPTRTDTDDRYFTDTYQLMPAEGYTRMFERMLDHPAIRVTVGTSFAPNVDHGPVDRIVYSGPIDAYFGHRLGKLPYRSLRFDHEHLADVAQYQPTGTVNYPGNEPFTRITEFKHLTGQAHPGTSIVREFPCAEGDPYYPIPREANEKLFKAYQALAEPLEPTVTFIGRLAQYRYYNMDQVVAASLSAADRLRSGLGLAAASGGAPA